METVLLALFGFFMLLLVVLFFGCESVSSLLSSSDKEERSIFMQRHDRQHRMQRSHRLS
ncbi:MAG: hypothetical protein ACK42Y_11885 [Candidatus Thermochlorobacter sp.]